MCAPDLVLTTHVTESGIVTTDLVANPSADNLSIGIESNELMISGIQHQVEVLAMSPANQCKLEAFVVNPWNCKADTFQPVQWSATSTDTIIQYNHMIGVDFDVWDYSAIDNLLN